MSYRFFLAVALIAAALGPGLALGQDATSTATANETATDETQRVDIELNGFLSIEEFQFDEGTFEVTFRADRTERVKVTDIGAGMEFWESGSGKQAESVSSEAYTIDRGRTTISIDATIYDGAAAISIGSTGDSARLRSDAINTGGPWARTSPGAGWLGGFTVVSIMAIVAARRVKNNVSEEPEDLV